MEKRMIYCGYCGREHQENSDILIEHQRLLGSDPRTYGAPTILHTEREKLLIPRIPPLPSKGRNFTLGEYREEEIAKYDVGDIYIDTFSTTSPPAFVTNEYRVTRKDREGVWGVLIDSSVREMDISEV